jgi:phosphate acyltransferase
MAFPHLDYRGFVEGHDIGKGTVDVVVTEGFSGNIALKTAEGTARQFFHYLRDALESGFFARIGALLARGALRALVERSHPRKFNGSVFLGLDGVVIKSHGGSDAVGTSRAIDTGYEMVRDDLLSKINESLTFPQPASQAIEKLQGENAATAVRS